MRIVCIEWEDARDLSTDPWTERQEWAYTPCIVHTVGFVLYDGPEGFLLTNNIHDTQTGPVNQIPRRMIRSVRDLA